jgi:bifunctional DNA-binding transcriptional regulator/antitoxin component of YhaV-PrlF toxin-antitoxin module
MEPNEKTETKRWTLPVDEDGVLILPDELWAGLGWKEGDSLEWVDQENGSFLLVKVEESAE